MLDRETPDTVAHRLLCPRYEDVLGLKAEFNAIFGYGKWTLREVLDPSLDLKLQIRTSNALHAFALSTSERGII